MLSDAEVEAAVRIVDLEVAVAPPRLVVESPTVMRSATRPARRLLPMHGIRMASVDAAAALAAAVAASIRPRNETTAEWN